MVAKGFFCGLEAYLEFLTQSSCSCSSLSIWQVRFGAENGLRKEPRLKN